MKKTILTSVLFLCFFLNYAQGNYIEGVVIDEQLATPIKGAIVTIRGTEFTEGTDNNGKFIFKQALPEGTYNVTVEKENFEREIFIIDVLPGKKIEVEEVKLIPTKREEYKRKKQAKKDKKEKRIADKLEAERVSDLERQLEREDKDIAKEIKRLEKRRRKGKVDDEDVIVHYEDTTIEPEPLIEDPVYVSEIQKKYGKILGMDPADLTEVELYELIDEWDDVDYLYSGVTKSGVDCSSFTQAILFKIYNIRIERTAEQQFHSKINDEYKGRQVFNEGDLIFFTGVGTKNNDINHVGVYLHNNMFVHSTSNKDKNGKAGVQISDLTDDYWAAKFLAGGRQRRN